MSPIGKELISVYRTFLLMSWQAAGRYTGDLLYASLNRSPGFYNPYLYVNISVLLFQRPSSRPCPFCWHLLDPAPQPGLHLMEAVQRHVRLVPLQWWRRGRGRRDRGRRWWYRNTCNKAAPNKYPVLTLPPSSLYHTKRQK